MKISNKLQIVSIFIVCAWFLCLISPSSYASSEINIKSEMLDERIVDAPLKTEIVQELLIKGNLSKEIIEKFIRNRYNLLKKRRGFKFHPTPTNIGVYLYASKEHYNSGMGQWIAMVYTAKNQSPEFIFDEGQIKYLNKRPEIKFNLSEETRKKIWNEAIHAEDRAWKEAEDAIPNRQSMDDLKRIGEMQERLNDKYNNKIIAKYNISEEIFKAIQLEGSEKSWPMPPEK